MADTTVEALARRRGNLAPPGESGVGERRREAGERGGPRGADEVRRGEWVVKVAGTRSRHSSMS